MDGLKGRQERSDPVTVPTWIQPQRDAFPKVTLLCRGEERERLVQNRVKQGRMAVEGDLTWGGERIRQRTDDVYRVYT